MTKAIVLAGGLGKRLAAEASDLPKALRLANGKPLLHYVLDALGFIKPEDTYIVVGYKHEEVRRYLGKPESEDDIIGQGSYNIVYQREQLGTGHAANMAAPYLSGEGGDTLVAFGDMPLFTRGTFEAFYREHIEKGNDCTILTDLFRGDDIPHYGRVIRTDDGGISAIVEQKDCTPEQKLVRELSVGPMWVKTGLLFKALAQVGNQNAQREYYLPDVPPILVRMGYKLGSLVLDDSPEIYGVNTPEDLAYCEAYLSKTHGA